MDSKINLTESQRQAVEHGDGPLLIVAGAGTGKTMVITRRIAALIESKRAKPEEVLALTFTEKAAAEMAERVDRLLPYGVVEVPISTFHAFGESVLREFSLDLGLNPSYQVLSEAEQVIFFREHLFQFPLEYYRPLGDPTRFIQAILKVISRAKDEDVSPQDYVAYARVLEGKASPRTDDQELRDEAAKAGEIAETYVLYQRFLAEAGKVDFGDLVCLVLRLFRERPEVLATVRKRYRYILVDEFQDTNFAQFQLLQLLGNADPNITVVGDDDQSIYKFRGAAISNILTFMDVYPNARQIVLTDNFRSTQIILDTAYRLIQHNNPDRLEVKNRIDKRLRSSRQQGPLVEHFHCDTLSTESDQLAAEISELVENKGYNYSDIAVLVRSNSTADPFLRAFNMKSIPWRFTGNRGLYNRPEVKLLISFMRAVVNPHDSISLYHLASSDVYELSNMEDLHLCLVAARRENRSLYDVLVNLEEREEYEKLSIDSRTTLKKMVSDLKDYLNLCRRNITGVVLYQFLTKSGYLKKLTRNESEENSRRVQNIARFFDVVWAFAQVAREDRLVHFVEYLDMLMEAGDDPGTAEADPDIDAVTVSTVHKAKGLEWPVVFMPALIKGRFPARDRSDPIELPDALIAEPLPAADPHLQEERRLFYVGMTRARDRLYFSSAADYGGVRSRKVSEFVLEALDRPGIEEVSRKTSAAERIQRFAPPPEGPEPGLTALDENTILELSHYKIDDYLTCPLKYKYVHILRLPFFHHTIVYGKAVHAAVELYYRYRLAGAPISLDDLYGAYEDAWRNIGFLSQEHEERRKASGREAIQRFWEKEEASGQLPALVEKEFSFRIGNDRVSGRWDRIDERDGEIIVADFKTSGVFQQKEADSKTKNSLQLVIYAMAYEKIHKRRPGALELHFLESGLVGRALLSDKMLCEAEEKIGTAAEGIRRRRYQATPGYQACRYCAYYEICPGKYEGEE